MKSSISIIIPVFNESATIIELLEHLKQKAFSISNISEIIVVDGGSDDDTFEKVATLSRKQDHSHIKILHSKKGRAAQMNTGSESAKGDILYFLHADSYPPQDYDHLIIKEVEQGNEAGCFKMKFDSNHWWLRLAGWLTQFEWRACRGGDQSQFITKNLFNELGRFDERYIIYEDNDLINKLYARNEFVVIQEWLTTSARRYEENGIWKLQYYFWSIYVRKWFGASPEELHQFYLKKVS
ncbi:TIGR04283 family arsenosugar biosynthesis glycosyltransferase [Dokdonia sp. Hel_I_53]|uniref:TIGR04283 family arsenosugar biosynthesis glycosyltransferase n=1 Tax=Dokdonia sp. Hel_I_53 TaxID=1566287 RepID=UPI00119C418F|nr:TIGR04283 family arsenosugar biosynthesis glycosyltransferase [Dokdonia sp. Hel_I_53]TVZ53075.1 rSAM/selenodomain-associated transferase 2 [Dokdonia sp. Hel_I_53]